MNDTMIYGAYQYLVWTKTKDLILEVLKESYQTYLDSGVEPPAKLIEVLAAMEVLVEEGGKL